MSSWYRLLLPLVMLTASPLAALPSPSADQPRVLAPAEAVDPAPIRAGADALCGRVAMACPTITSDAPAGRVFARNGDRLMVAPALLAEVRGAGEARAAAALALAWYDPGPPARRALGPTIVRQAAALAMYAAGTQLAPLSDPQDRYAREAGLQNDPEADPPAQDPGLAQRAVRLVETGDGCSGPLVDLLRRAAALPPTAPLAQRSVRAFAQRMLASLGAQVYPPDYHCVGQAHRPNLPSGIKSG